MTDGEATVPANQDIPTVGSRPRRAGAAALFLLSVGLGVLVHVARPERLGVTGDEPHYLIMADSVVHDRTLDLRNAYKRNSETSSIYGGPLAPHVAIVNHRWAPYHGPGLALLLAVPYLLGSTLGAKLAMCLAVGLLPVALRRFFLGRIPARDATWLAVGATVSLPFCFGATQIFPDLITGTIAMILAVWLIERDGGSASLGAWAIFWTTAGVLPWLNTKYLAVTLALSVCGLALSWAERRRGRLEAAWRVLAVDAFVALGPVALAAYHVWAVDTPLGPRQLTEVASPFSRAAEMFLGLHFDQSQGMFVQHPFLLLGVAGWPLFARRRPGMALCWLVLYASLIVPNSLELARWGGGGPVGRFAWSAAWLWAIPLGFAVAERYSALARWIRPAVIASLAYQVLLALRWLPELHLLYPRLEEQLDARDSLFPLVLRRFLPSFYFWDFSSYWTYPPNLVAYGLFAALLLAGFAASMNGRPRTPSRG